MVTAHVNPVNLAPSQVRSVSLETKQICAKALLNLVAEDTLPALIEVGTLFKVKPLLPHSNASLFVVLLPLTRGLLESQSQGESGIYDTCVVTAVKTHNIN